MLCNAIKENPNDNIEELMKYFKELLICHTIIVSIADLTLNKIS